MQTKGHLIYNDIVAVFAFGLIVYDFSIGRAVTWIVILFIYLITKQIIAHRAYFKINNKFY